MSSRKMSQTRRQAWLETVIWTVAGVGFAVTFFAGQGATGFAEDSTRHLAGAGALAFGFLGHWMTLWYTRQRPGTPPTRDERDLQIMARANQATLIVVLLAVFAFTIGLWVTHEAHGQVPVGWMWFLAYGSVILASLSSAVATLILDGRMGGHA